MDKRTAASKESIKRACLALLASKPLSELKMSELAQQAGVSRSTLYAHYATPREVFDELVDDFAAKTSGLSVQLRCGQCRTPGLKAPFCEQLRAAGPYQPLVLEPEFLPQFLRVILDDVHAEKVLAPYRQTGASEAQARSLLTFQISGCYMAATTAGGDALWSDSQQAIDGFIRGGLSGLRPF